jgi:hypothetical protein
MAATDTGLLYEGAFGTRDLAKGPAIDPRHGLSHRLDDQGGHLRPAMQLVEQGALDVDAPVPDIDRRRLATRSSDGFDAAGGCRSCAPRSGRSPAPSDDAHAGFSYEAWDSNTVRYVKASGMPSTSTARSPRCACRWSSTRRQVGVWVNIDWLGRIVEAVGGRTIDAYFRDSIFVPLGMKDSGSSSRRAALAPGQRASAPGRRRLMPQPRETPFVPEFYAGAAGSIDGADYLAFLQMLLNGGRPTARASCARRRSREMHSNHHRRDSAAS